MLRFLGRYTGAQIWDGLPPPDAALQAHSLAVATRVVLKRCLTHHALSNYVLSKFLERFVARLVVRPLMEYPSLADLISPLQPAWFNFDGVTGSFH